MRLCLSCRSGYPSFIQSCQNCGYVPIVVEGFDSYAPDLAHEGGGFKENYFSNLANLEDTNFWFQSRNNLIMWALGKYAPNFQSFLEVGCGTGYVLNGISKKFPYASLYGSEIFVAGLGFAAARLPSSKFMQMDARNIPFDNEFDVMGAFDVLEHIKEDEEVLTQMYKALKPKGWLFITVPQHAWLWSSTDEYAQHERRYAASNLHGKVEAAGFSIIRSTSFITTLLPAMMIARLWQKKMSDKEFDASAELKISPWLNALFLRVLCAESALIKGGINLPFGGSRLVVAQKI
jgi:trans-aconitate methyltransferase